MTADQPGDYAGYVVDSSHIFLLSTDPHSTTILLSAVGKRQEGIAVQWEYESMRLV